jgi:hypothetical protein
MEINRVGDLSGVLGIFISLIGFAVTLIGVWRAAAAAEAARTAARAAKESITLLQTVVDFSLAISTLEAIKREHRLEQWALLPDRYAYIRKILITLRHSGVTMTDSQKGIVQNAIVNLSDIERTVERALAVGAAARLKTAKFNGLIANDIDQLQTVFVSLKESSLGV